MSSASAGARASAQNKVGLVGAIAAMPHGRHQLDMLRSAAAQRGVQLVELDGQALDDALARKESTGHSGLSGCVCFREAHTYPTAVLDDSGNDPAAVARLKRKDEARQCLREAGFAQPATASDPSAIPGPWVVKPRSGSGSEGVSIHTELSSARAALDAMDNGFVETFVEGREFSVEGFFFDSRPHVLGVTDKRLDGVVETGHRYPSVELAEHEGEIAAAVESALHAWGLSAGIFHVEGWWVEGSGVILGEGHVRPGGDYIHLLVSSVHGRNIFDALIADVQQRYGQADQAFDASIYPPRRQGHSAAVRYIEVPAGTIRSVDGVEEALNSPGVIAGYCSAEPGLKVGRAQSSGQRLGCLVAHAGPGEEPDELLDRAMSLIRIEVGN